MARGHGMTSEGLERVLHPPRTEHDQPPKYRPHEGGDMDPGRFDVVERPGRCWPSWGPVHDSLVPSKWRWWVECRDCRRRLHGSSEKSLRRRMAEHVGEES